MRNRKLLLILSLVISISVALMGCTPKSSTSTEPTGDQLVVYASIYPLYDFAKAIGKDLVNVNLVVPPGTEAHDFEPAAKLVGAIGDADILLYNGIGLEHWVESLVASVGGNLLAVNTSEGIETIAIEAGHDHEEGEEHKEGESAEEHDHGNTDPHIWLDPQRANLQAKNILEAFKKADPNNAAQYEANYKMLEKSFVALDQEFDSTLKDFSNREIVVGHAAFGYLANRYNLEQLAISGISPLEEPSAVDLAELTQLIDEHNIRVIFYEELASSKFSEVLAQETGTKTAVLNPIEGLTQDQMDAGKDYFSIMRENLAAIANALK